MPWNVPKAKAKLWERIPGKHYVVLKNACSQSITVLTVDGALRCAG